MTDRRLLPSGLPREPKGVVVVLHGGGSRGARRPVSRTQLSVIRMLPFARSVFKAGAGQLAVYRLLNTYRGWDPQRTPVHDIHAALDEISHKHPGLPVCLVGHSLGGRAAIMTGTHPLVAGVVALNPWFYATDNKNLGGQRLLIVHGDDDRIAHPKTSLAVATRLSASAHVTFVMVRGARHAMLRERRIFEDLTNRFVVTALVEGGWVLRPATSKLEMQYR